MLAILYVLKIILFPLMLIISFVIRTRNWCYDKGIFKSKSPNVFTINIGNLTVGGTGKTPHIEYLIRLLSDSYIITVLSRGYGRKTKGFLIADDKSNAQIIGDEPFQIYQKFKQNTKVAVCENRLLGVKKIQEKYPENKIVLLDDAFQHRAILPHFNILLSDFNRPFYTDSMIPNGRLRDLKSSAIRADLVILTKIPPNISSENYDEIRGEILKYTRPNTPIFFSKIKYLEIKNYKNEPFTRQKEPFALIEGIANIEPMLDYLKSKNYLIKKSYRFRDHFDFDRKTIDKILSECADYQFITTEKDMVKIKPLLNEKEVKRFFYLPIEVEIENAKVFNELILRRFKEFEDSKSK